MDFLALSAARKSTRGFTDQPVSDEDIRKLITAGCNAPSAGNSQPWHFYVVKDRRVLERMQGKVFGSGWINSAYAIIVVCADVALSEQRYGERGRTLYCFQDTAAATQNILLCATDLGISTCWVGSFNEKECASVLHLPENHRPVVLIPIGYAEPAARRSDRKPLEDVLTMIEEES